MITIVIIRQGDWPLGSFLHSHTMETFHNIPECCGMMVPMEVKAEKMPPCDRGYRTWTQYRIIRDRLSCLIILEEVTTHKVLCD